MDGNSINVLIGAMQVVAALVAGFISSEIFKELWRSRHNISVQLVHLEEHEFGCRHWQIEILPNKDINSESYIEIYTTSGSSIAALYQSIPSDIVLSDRLGKDRFRVGLRGFRQNKRVILIASLSTVDDIKIYSSDIRVSTESDVANPRGARGVLLQSKWRVLWIANLFAWIALICLVRIGYLAG